MSDLFEKTKERVRGKQIAMPDAEPKTKRGKGHVAPRGRTVGSTPATAAPSTAIVPKKESNLLASIVEAARDPSCSPEKMHALADLRKRLMEEQAEVAFTSAFIDLRAALPMIRKDGKIEIEGRSGKKGGVLKFASYENIMVAVQPHLTKHRFEVHLSTRPNASGEGHHIHGELVHVCDTAYGPLVWRKTTHMPAVIEAGGAKNNAQGIGSGLTYARRYAIRDLVNLISFAAEDRDTDGKPRLPTVDAEQCAAVKAAIKFCGADESEFCKHYGIDKVENLLAEHYGEALDACKRRKEKLDAAQAS